MRVRITLSEKEVVEIIKTHLRNNNMTPTNTHFEFKIRVVNSRPILEGIECDINPKSLEDDF